MKRRVLYVMANAEMGGAERITLLMVNHHDRFRYEPSVLFLSDGTLVERTRRSGIPTFVHKSPLRLRNPLQIGMAIATCRRIVLEQRIDLIHSCMSYSHVIASTSGALSGRPAVLFQHGPVGGWLDRIASLLPAAYVLVNSEHTGRCHAAVALRSRPMKVVPCSTDLDLSEAESERLRAEVNRAQGLDDDTIVLTALGRLDPWKGFDVALRAAAPLLRERDGIRFFLVGGQYRQLSPGHGSDLRELVRREGIEDRVIFTGHQEDVLPFLARTDILVHSAVTPEPFGLVILEGMAAGKAVVASRAGGPLEIISDRHDGLFHQPGDVADLRARLLELLEDPALRTSLGARAKETIAGRFTPAAMMSRLEASYDEVLRREGA